MKNFKKFTAAVAATLMAASLSIPMATSFTASAASIEITGISATQAHTFEVYQVFTGDLVEKTEDGITTKILSNLKWGSDVTAYKSTTVTPGDAVKEEIAKELTEATDARAIVGDFSVGTPSKTVFSTSDSITIDDLADGYYIVKDTTDLGDKDDANSAWIVQVAGTTEIAIKNAKPTVDKQVLDEVDDAEEGSTDGWGETADHAINEEIQFKLTATIPADEDLAAYDSYKITFNDTMSAGITFRGITSVTVDGKNVVLGTGGYSVANTAGGTGLSALMDAAGLSWTLTIDDVKSIAGTDFGKKDIVVEVIYTAHLNENAIVSNGSVDSKYENEYGTIINNNKVSLSYSNNPDSTGTGTTDGKTPEDTVGVFTYEVDNIKYANSVAEGNELKGATFRLYSDEDCTKEIYLSYNEGKGAYIPKSAGNTTGDAMESNGDGVFNILGLDAGTYYLKEESAPAGYNLLTEATPITISATHAENASEDGAKMTITADSDLQNVIINKSGSTLPSTGGIGTKLFYIGGGCMVAVAGIFLITKKRMGRNAQ